MGFLADAYNQAVLVPRVENQGRKSLRLCWAGLRIRRFDPVAKLSELPDHLPSAALLRFFGDRWAPFFVTNSLMQDEPDQSTLSISNGPNGLIVSQAGEPTGDKQSRRCFLWFWLRR
jgi:hypothetical protein